MKEKLIKILAIMILLTILMPNILQTSMTLAATATDYDFTNELETDRVGIGFTWTASSKTLQITGIKNSSAEIILPSGSTIDIQGNTENTVKYIYCNNGSLTIKGNNQASLNVVNSYKYKVNGSYTYYASIYSSYLTIMSGNINITPKESSYYPSKNVYGIRNLNKFLIYGGNVNINNSSGSNAINAPTIQINGGTINADSSSPVFSSEGENSSYYSDVYGKIIINGGEIIAKSAKQYIFHGNTTINGGKIEAYTKSTSYYGVFVQVPSINPKYNWIISYNKEEADLNNTTEADITDIYNIYNSKAMKIELDKSNPGDSSLDSFIVTNATDYDFTDELENDRLGIGFTWTASNKTLKITGIKNSNAEIILPNSSTISIQGKDENVVKNITCNGYLTIIGNDIAKLNVVKSYKYKTDDIYEYYTSIYANTLTIKSGNINITTQESSSYPSTNVYGIRTLNKCLISGGNIVIDNASGSNAINSGFQVGNIQIDGGTINASSVWPVFSTEGEDSSYYSTVYGKITINGGTIVAKSTKQYIFHGNTTINGGNIEGYTKSTSNYGVFVQVPSINPECNWKIFYNKVEADLENLTETDITDIYNIYNSKAMKISLYIPTTSISISSSKETICVDEKTNFTANVEPENVTDNISWSSSNDQIATVSENGQVTGIAPGKATITTTSGDYTDSKDINVVCSVALDANGVEGIETETLYTDTDGKLQTLPKLAETDDKIFEKWVDNNENEVTLDTQFTNNTTIYARWINKTISVGEQNKMATYGENSSVKYNVTSNIGGTYEIKIDNLPTGVTLDNNTITLAKNSNATYEGIITLNISNIADACDINNLKITVNNIESNNFNLKIDKANSIYQAPTGKVLDYTGNEQELITVGTTNDGTMKYSLEGNTYSTDIPKAMNVGKYTIYYKVIGDSNHNDSEIYTVDSLINKINSQIETEPTGKTLTYDGTNKELVIAGTTQDGIMEYSLDGNTYSTDIPTAINAGKYKIYYRVVGDNNHNNSEIKSIDSVINKAESSVENAPKGKMLLYKETEQELITAGTTKDGTIQYSLDGNIFSANIPTGIDTGKYTIYYKIIGDNNHNDSKIATVATTISKTNSTLETEPIGKTLLYNKEEQELVIAGITRDGTLEYSLDGNTFSPNIPTGINAEEYTIYYKVRGDSNHNDSEINIIYSKISKADSTIEIEPEGKTLLYNKAEQELVIAGTTKDGIIEYSLDGNTFSKNIPTRINAGKYTIYYKVIGDSNHNDSQIGTTTTIINKINSTIETEPVGKIVKYNEQEQNIVIAGTTSDGTMEYSLDGDIYSTDIPTAINAGEYKIYYRVKGDNNHFDSKIKSVSAVIEKTNSSYEQQPTAKNLTENGKEQELINIGITQHGTIQYSLDGINYSSDIPKAIYEGTYKVYYKIIGDQNHIDTEVNSIDVTVKKLFGDLNGDNKQNARDAKMILQFYTGLIELTEKQKEYADVNKDGKINARDAKLILQLYTGKITEF